MRETNRKKEDVVIPKTRTIKELLQLMLDNKKSFKYGLCDWIDTLFYRKIITMDEFYLLDEYIMENPPLIDTFRGFFSAYYWTRGRIKPRIKWIKRHIAKN